MSPTTGQPAAALRSRNSLTRYIFGHTPENSAAAGALTHPRPALDSVPQHVGTPSAPGQPGSQSVPVRLRRGDGDGSLQVTAEAAAGGGSADSPAAPAADMSELPPVAAYRRAIVQSLADTVGTVTGPLQQGGRSYVRLLNRVISGGELLGAVDDGEVGGAAEQAPRGVHGAREPGAEALLALTLEAFTDICRYPRYGAIPCVWSHM